MLRMGLNDILVDFSDEEDVQGGGNDHHDDNDENDDHDDDHDDHDDDDDEEAQEMDSVLQSALVAKGGSQGRTHRKGPSGRLPNVPEDVASILSSSSSSIDYGW